MKIRILRFSLAIGVVFFCVTHLCAENLNRKEEDAFYVAVKSYQDGFYDIALTLFDRFLKTYMDSDKRIEALIYTGQCYYFQEKYVRALDQFESLLKISGVQRVKDKVLFWLGEIYAKGRAYPQAAEFYQQLIKNYKDSSYLLSAYKSLAQVQFNEGNFQEAMATYRTILSEFKDSAVAEEASLGICESLYRLRNYIQLKKEIDHFIVEYPRSQNLGRAYLYLAEANFYLNQFQEAVLAYRAAENNSTDYQQQATAQLGLGWSLLKLKKYSEAEKVFAEFPDDGASLGVLLGRAVLKSGLGEYEKSIPFFDGVIAADKNIEYAPLAYFGKAEAFYNLGNFDEAIVAYRVSMDKLKAASGIYTDSKELKDKIRYGLAWSYLKKGDFRSAQEEFQKVVSFTQDKIFKISAMCQLGDAYQDAGDYKKALEAYENFLKEYPQSLYDDYIQYQVGMTFLKMKDLETAILAFRRLLKDYPSTKLMDDANYFLGVTYFQKGDFVVAKEQLGKFLNNFKDSPYRPQALFLLGESLLNLSEFKAAIDVFQSVQKEFLNQVTLRQKAEYEIANAYAQMGNDVEANKRLSDFITRYPDSQLSPDILFWLGEFYRNKKDFASARKYFERLIRNYPDHEALGDAFLEIGSTYLEEDKIEAALRSFEQARDAGQGEVVTKALLSLGDAYASKSDLNQALKNYQKASLRADAWAKTAYVKMASVSRQQKDFQQAMACYEKALALEGPQQNAAIQFQLADVLQEQGLSQEALEAYMKVSYLYAEDEAWVVKALLRVAQIYENKEQWAELKAILEKISNYPVPEAKYAKEKLVALKNK